MFLQCMLPVNKFTQREPLTIIYQGFFEYSHNIFFTGQLKEAASDAQFNQSTTCSQWKMENL